jgi:hypothetical protein
LQYSTCEVLVDGLFAIISDLETSIVETILSRKELTDKVDFLQVAVLNFKRMSLKVLNDQINELLKQTHAKSTESEFEQFQSYQLSVIQQRR